MFPSGGGGEDLGQFRHLPKEGWESGSLSRENLVLFRTKRGPKVLSHHGVGCGKENKRPPGKNKAFGGKKGRRRTSNERWGTPTISLSQENGKKKQELFLGEKKRPILHPSNWGDMMVFIGEITREELEKFRGGIPLPTFLNQLWANSQYGTLTRAVCQGGRGKTQ